MSWFSGKGRKFYQRMLFYCWKQSLTVVGYFTPDNIIPASGDVGVIDKEIVYYNENYLTQMSWFSSPGCVVVSTLDDLAKLTKYKVFMIANSLHQQRPILYIIDSSKGKNGQLDPDRGVFVATKSREAMQVSMEALKDIVLSPEDRNFSCYIRDLGIKSDNLKKSETVSPKNITSVIVSNKKTVIVPELPVISLYTERGKKIKGIDLKPNKL